MRTILFLIGSLAGCLCAFNKNNITLNVKDSTITVTVPYVPEIKILFFSTDINDDCFSNYTFVSNPSINATYSYKMDVNNVFQKDDTINMFGVFGFNDKLETQTYNFKIDDKGNGVKQASNRPATKTCIKSETEVKFKNQECSGNLIFEENFDDPLLSNWKPEKRSMVFASPPAQEFVAYVDYKENMYVKNSRLYLNATWVDNSAYYPIREFELKNCTSKEKNEKKKKNICGPIRRRPGFILPPVYTAKLINKEFTFKYGRIEIRARMPIGEWLFPYLILQPANTDSETLHVNHIRIAYVRGNKDLFDNKLNPINAQTLFGSAVLWSNNTYKEYMNAKLNYTTKLFGEAFHNYTLIWKKDRISFKVDGLIYGTITNPDVLHTFSLHECFIVLGLTAGGALNFSDDYLKPKKKPFKNDDVRAAEIFSEKTVRTSWRQPSLMVDYVRVYTI